MVKRRTSAERKYPGKAKLKPPSAAAEQRIPGEAKYFRIHNLLDDPFDFPSLGPLFQLVEDAVGSEFAGLFAVRGSQNADHHDVDFAILKMPSNLPCGSLQTFVQRLQYLADIAVDTGLANDE